MMACKIDEWCFKIIKYRDGYAIKYDDSIIVLYFNVFDDGFSTYLHKNCFIATRDEAERILTMIKENQFAGSPYFLHSMNIVD